MTDETDPILPTMRKGNIPITQRKLPGPILSARCQRRCENWTQFVGWREE